jgi:hypothetical protein
VLKYQIGLQLWITRTLRWILIWLGQTIRENIKISAQESLHYYELKKHKPWFDEECSKLLDHRKQAKSQWLQDPIEINGDNLNNIRYETSRHFRGRGEEGISERQN